VEPGALVVLHLVNPPEKYWGVLRGLGVAGIEVRGIGLSSFDDWMNSLLYDEEVALGLATIFFPLHRLERLFLDERVGQVESLAELFERRVGRPVREVIGEPAGGPIGGP
jgi:hypothetical protein